MAYRSIQPHHQVPAERTVHRHVQCIVTSHKYIHSVTPVRKQNLKSIQRYSTEQPLNIVSVMGNPGHLGPAKPQT